MKRLLILILLLLIISSCETNKPIKTREKDILKNIEIRKALASLIDKEKIVNEMNKAYYKEYEINIYTLSNKIFIDSNVESNISYNPELAKEILEENIEKGLEIKLKYYVYETYSYRLFEHIYKESQEIEGFDILGVPANFNDGDFCEKYNNNKIKLVVTYKNIEDKAKFLSDWIPKKKKCYHTSDGNYTRWNNDDYNRIIMNINSGYLNRDSILRDEAIARAEKILLDEYMIVPILHRDNKHLLYLTFILDQ